MRTEVLVTVYSSSEAALIQGNLANQGIQSYITNDISSTLLPHLNGMMGGGIKILVDEGDLSKASEIIAPGEKSIISCPRCNSQNIRYGPGRSRSRILLVLLSLIAWIPFGNAINSYHCVDCKHDFK